MPKAKAKAKAKAKKTTAKYAYLPPDLRGAAKFMDEKNLITNINKVMNRDGRVETLLPRGDDPAHVGMLHRVADLGEELEPGPDAEGVARAELGDGQAADELHHEVGTPRRRHPAVDAQHLPARRP